MNRDRRPQRSLDGRWDLTLVAVPGHRSDSEHQVTVPGSWTLQVPGAELAHGTVRYRRTFTVPDGWLADGVCVLRFGAVNHAAEVRLNGTVVGDHVGGWTPWEVVLPPETLTGAEEQLEVEVRYPPLLASADGSPGMQEAPHGKQSWYGTNAGIWQPVVLEHRHVRHLRQVVVRPDATARQVTVDARLSAPPSVDHVHERLRVTVAERGRPGVAGAVTVALPRPAATAATAVVPLEELRRWSPDAPHRYDVTVSLLRDGEVADTVTRTTGFRDITTADGRLVLNGVPIEVRGVLDQDYHPGSELRPSSREELAALFRRAKALGFNLVRCHIKRPDPVYFELADEVGLLVWAELPSWQLFTRRSAAAAEALLADVVELDGHHPSIIAWTVVNESWGVDLRDVEQRAWMADTQQHLKTLVGDALVVDNSPCEPNFHVVTDVADYHIYRGIPENRADWDAWVDEFADRPGWLFSPYGDARSIGDEPLIVSEFGNWGLPDITLASPDPGAYEWWAEAGEDWAFGAARASGVVERFTRLGLDEVFGSWQGFVAATQRQQLLATRYQIGAIRRRPEIAGYVLTQLSDVQWEANGLFDMDRRPRDFLDEFALSNQRHGIVLRPSAHSGFVGDTIDLLIDVVPDPGSAHEADWRVHVRLDGADVDRFDVPAGQRVAYTTKLSLPSGPAVAEVTADLLIGGDLVARDVASVAVVAPLVPRQQPVVVDDGALAAWLPSLEVPVVDEGGEDLLLVTRRFGPAAQARARRGGRVLVIAEDLDALGGAFAAPLLARLSLRQGDDWVPRFDWLRREGPFAALPGGPLLDLAFEQVIGPLVVDFLPAPLRPARLYSATFAGWLQHRASTALTVPWSQGSVTISTFRLRTAAASDAIAPTLTRALLDAAGAG